MNEKGRRSNKQTKQNHNQKEKKANDSKSGNKQNINDRFELCAGAIGTDSERQLKTEFCQDAASTNSSFEIPYENCL